MKIVSALACLVFECPWEFNELLYGQCISPHSGATVSKMKRFW